MNDFNHTSDKSYDTASQLHRSALRLIRLMQGDRTNGKLSLAQISVLARLHREGEATATSVAAYLRVLPQSLTRLLADLEQRKLITRRPDDRDRRQSLLAITAEGRRLLVEDVRGQRSRLAEILARELTPAEQELLRLSAGLMDKLAAAVDGNEGDGDEIR